MGKKCVESCSMIEAWVYFNIDLLHRIATDISC